MMFPWDRNKKTIKMLQEHITDIERKHLLEDVHREVSDMQKRIDSLLPGYRIEGKEYIGFFFRPIRGDYLIRVSSFEEPIFEGSLDEIEIYLKGIERGKK